MRSIGSPRNSRRQGVTPTACWCRTVRRQAQTSSPYGPIPIRTHHTTTFGIHADAGTPNGLLGGERGDCGEANEDISIALDRIQRTITRRDNNIDPAPIPMTDRVITRLDFTYLDANRAVTTGPAGITFVRVEVTAQGNAMNARTGDVDTHTASTEVRLKAR